MTGPPHDPDAEQAVVGGCLAYSDAIAQAAAGLDQSDFYDMGLGRLFAVITDLHRDGQAVDHVTIAATFAQQGWELDRGDLIQLKANGLRPRQEHLEVIAKHSLGRRLMATAGRTRDEIGAGADPAQQLEDLRAALDGVDVPVGAGQLTSVTLDELVAAGATEENWVIPGLVRRDWRVVVVGPEGSGKSVLQRQIATCAAQGVHPLRFVRMEPIRVLIIDAENPAGAVIETGQRLLDQVRRTVGEGYDAGRLRLLMKPGGLDIRSRRDRAEVERELVNHRPDVVIAGPAYKLAARRDRESFEDLADATHRVLDDLRTRYGFGLIVEHHAPHSAAGSVREMRPYGGSQWLRWPEIGIGLRANDDHSGFELARWRGDRLRNHWPDEIRRDRVWPWVGTWNDGTAEAF
jgi:hypothetical protein